MKNFPIAKKEIIHFIGIGGIGMSGLAQIMKNMGFNVQGSDQSKNKNFLQCKKLGIKLVLGHKKQNIKNATIIVRSSAIKKNNPEIIAAKEKKLPIYDRAVMLSNVVSFKKNIVVTGSHGKTTTTSLISKILADAKVDPTIINGGIINSLKNNAKLGNSEWTVLEADESDGSFLKFPCHYSVVTNIDYEHLDYYKSFKKLKSSFLRFLKKTPPIGKSIICIDDSHIKEISKKIDYKNIVTYGFGKSANYQISNYRSNKLYSLFDVKINFIGNKKYLIKNLKLKLIGKHNVYNATAAIAIALSMGIKLKIIKKSLGNFTGVQRRFTYIFNYNKTDFYDDYAHHPTEIKGVIQGLKESYPNKKLIVVFQPHRYSRVKLLYNDFASAFKNAGIVLLLPIYAAGEKIDRKHNHNKFAAQIGKNSKVQTLLVKDVSLLPKFFRQNLFGDNIVVGMGAGDVSNTIRNLKLLLQ